MAIREERRGWFNLPNSITCIRIIGALCLLFTELFSIRFYIVYTICGISDALDGFVARATKKASEFGAKLDSAADLIFYGSLMICLFPHMMEHMAIGVWILGFSVVAIRLITYIMVAVRNHRFSAMHTYANKLSGLAVFSMPYFLGAFSTTLVCGIGATCTAIAAVEELILHILLPEYRSDVKTIFQLKRARKAEI